MVNDVNLTRRPVSTDTSQPIEPNNDSLSTEDAPVAVTNLIVIQWSGPNDPQNPFNWPTAKKWWITGLAIFATFTTLLNGTIITVAHETISSEFQVSDTAFPNTYWSVTSWAVGGGISVLFVLPLLEDFGVRFGFLGTYLILICFIVPQAVAKNFATFVIVRFFSGGCASILANTAASVIGNIWEGEVARTVPMGCYVSTYIAGISAGPVIGGVVYRYLDWRWLSYLQLIWYGAFFPVYYLFMDESRGFVILQHRAKKNGYQVERRRDRRLELRNFLVSIRRPIFMLCTEPVVFVFTMWSALAVGTVYLFTQSTEQVFVTLYGWNASQAGYVQGALVIGACIGMNGALIGSRFYAASAKHNVENPGIPIPEARLYMSTIGSIFGIAGGMFVYGWSSYSFIPWIVPAIGLAMVGAGSVTVVLACSEYVVDAYAKYAASAVAALVLGENTVSAFVPLAAQSMYTNLGFHWASSLLGFVTLALSIIPFVLLKWGRTIRERSPFMKDAIINASANA